MWDVRIVTFQPNVKEDLAKLQEDLANGWEPFAVTVSSSYFSYHLRKKSTSAAPKMGFA